jgi:hypothetical protein
MKREQVLQDRRRDVVGKIADYARRSDKRRIGVARQARTPQQALEIDVQHVAFNNLNPALVGILHAQLRAQHAVQFNGDDVLGAPNQQRGQHTASGTDLDHGALGHVAQGINDSRGRCPVGEEVLAQFGTPARSGCGSCHLLLLPGLTVFPKAV